MSHVPSAARPKSRYSGFPTTCDPWTNGDITGGAVLNNAWWAASGARGYPPLGGISVGGALVRYFSGGAWIDGTAYGIQFRNDGDGNHGNIFRYPAPTVRCYPE